MKTVAIIGGGVAGLSCAARLQKAGYKTTVYDKNSTLGGRMNVINGKGFKFDLAPTIVMMPEVYRKLFIDCGKNPDDYIPMFQLKNTFDLFFKDKKIPFPSDLAEIHKMLENIDKESPSGFFEYISVIYKRYIIARDSFITKSFNKKRDFYNPKTLTDAYRLKTFSSADRLIGKYIKNDMIKKMLSFQTLYIGVSPYQGPSLYSIIPMIELVYGIWFMKGGMRTMAEGMIKLCEELGVNLLKNENVEKILIKDKAAYGIVSNGKEHYFDIVVNTSDFPYAINNLISDTKLKGKYNKKKFEKMDYACSAYLLYLGLDRNLKDKMSIHSIIFSNDFDGNIKDIFEGRFPSDPSIYAYVPSVLDPSLAPNGKDGLYILVPVPELKTGKQNWENKEEVCKFRKAIFKKIETIEALKDIEKDIIFEHTFTPLDFKNVFNAEFGAAFGLRPTLMQSNHLRPQSKIKNIKNLYFAGASNHPGAGVPIVLTGGEIAAKEVIKDNGTNN